MDKWTNGQTDKRTNGQMDKWTNGQTDEQTNVQMENLPILQDFVPNQGRCPASPMKPKEKVEQGKGTADH